MKTALVILALALSSIAKAEPCSERVESVKEELKASGFKLIASTTDDEILSITFRIEEVDGAGILTFVYTTNRLLAIEATLRGFKVIPSTCSINGMNANVLARFTKRTKA
jgi:hypothetical protein